MNTPDPDIQRWLQLMVDDKLTFREFALLGLNKGYSASELLSKCIGISVTVKVPVEWKK